MILLLNGAFGIGKTTVARALIARAPGAAIFDPETIGVLLLRAARLAGYAVDDFQDIRAWRRLTLFGLRVARLRAATVVVPMAFSNASYLSELREGIERFEPQRFHSCLVAPVEVVHARLAARGADPGRHAWQYRRAAECSAVHGSAGFATHVDAANRTSEELADYLLSRVSAATGVPAA
ncbi:MAG: hypothetical protein H0U59_08765 [Gemmatimonadaceae bacterium]|nr:hypothetical protein [Gemmatimonadaceae bacterium]